MSEGAGLVRLISTGEAIGFLSQVAPKPWVHRFLLWMAFNENLRVYSTRGKIQPYCAIGEFYVRHSEEAGEFSGAKMDAVIKTSYEQSISDRIIGNQLQDRFDDDPNTWDETGDPVQLDVGFFIFSRDIDWSAGSLKADAIPGYGEMFETYFWADSDHLGTSLERASYDAEVTGLKFEFSEIELLLPNFPLQKSFTFGPEAMGRSSHIGRPPDGTGRAQ